MFGVSCVHDKALVDVEFHQPLGLPSPKCVKQFTNPNPDLKGALYRIWCGVNRLGDSGVKVV